MPDILRLVRTSARPAVRALVVGALAATLAAEVASARGATPTVDGAALIGQLA